MMQDNWFGRMTAQWKLSQKMVIAFLLFGFAPMLLVSLLLQNRVIRELKLRAEQTSVASLEQTAERVNDRLMTFNLIVSNVASDAMLLNQLTQPYERLSQSIDFYHYVSRMRLSILRTNPDVVSLCVYIAHPDLVSAEPYLVNMDNLDEIEVFSQMRQASFTPALTGIRHVSEKGDYWFPMAQDTDAQETQAVFAINRLIVPSRFPSRVVGIATLSVRQEALRDFISSDIQHTVTMIVNEGGIIITASDETMTGQQASGYIPDDLWKRDVLEPEVFRSTNGQMLVMNRELRWGWKMVTVIAVDEIQASARTVQQMGILLTSICAFAAILLVVIASSKMATRFRLLLDKFVVSDSGLVKPGARIEGRDEAAQLDRGFRSMATKLNQVIQSLYEAEGQKREALLIALQSRINPHFLYNTLSSIGWMTDTHAPEQVRKALELLATYYRASLSGGKDIISLREEILGLESYIALQKMRAGGRLHATIHMDPALEGLELPKMTLQPIVENSIEHGFGEGHPTVSIWITSTVEGQDALLHITDDGIGISEQRLAQLREGSLQSTNGGYGIRNVQMRLRMFFGENYGLDIQRLAEGGTRVTVRIPLVQESLEKR